MFQILKREIKRTANQLTEVDVEFISLVKRGANQSPFKILKTEDSPMEISKEQPQKEGNSMIDLVGKIGDYFSSTEDQAGTSVGAILIKNDKDQEALKTAIKDAGFNVDLPVDNGKAIALKQAEGVDLEALTYFQSSPDIVVGISGVQKAFDPFSESASFAESIKKNGFLPGVRVASSVLQETIFQTLTSADKSADLRSGLKKNLAEFSSFIMELASNIPNEAFKLDAIKVDVPAEALASASTAKESTAKEDAALVSNPALTAESGEAQGDLENPLAMETLMKTSHEKLVDLISGMKTELAKQINVSDAKVKDLAGILAGFSEKFKQMEVTVSDAKKTAQKTEQVITGTVLTNAVDSNEFGLTSAGHEERTESRKSDPEDTDKFWEGALDFQQFS